MTILWTPAEIDSAKWLHAPDSDTLTVDGSSEVTDWADKNGNGMDAEKAAGSITVATDSDGNQYLDFDAASMTLPTLGVSGSDARAVFVIADMPSDQATGLFAIGYSAGNSGVRWSFRQAGSGTDLRIEIQGAGYSSGTLACLGKGIYACTFDGTNLGGHTLWKDGVSDAASGSDAVNTTDNDNALGRANSSSDVITAKYYGVIFLPEDPSTETREKIEGYYAHLLGWEDRLDASHPYKSSAPTIPSLLGNALFRANFAARQVRLLDATGAVLYTATPEQSGADIGDYEIAEEAGPIQLQAQAFDPENWQGIWQANTVYEEGDIVFSNGSTDGDSLVLEVTAVSGASESGASEPTWDATEGNTTTDNDLTWTTLGTVADLSPITNFYVAE